MHGQPPQQRMTPPLQKSVALRFKDLFSPLGGHRALRALEDSRVSVQGQTSVSSAARAPRVRDQVTAKRKNSNRPDFAFQ